MEQAASGLPVCSEIPARSEQAHHPSPCDNVTVQSCSPCVLGRWLRHMCGLFLSPTYLRRWDLLGFLKDASDASRRSDHPAPGQNRGCGTQGEAV